MIEKALEKRPENTVKKLGKDNKLLLLSSHDLFDVLREKKVIIMTCNIRIKHGIHSRRLQTTTQKSL